MKFKIKTKAIKNIRLKFMVKTRTKKLIALVALVIESLHHLLIITKIRW